MNRKKTNIKFIDNIIDESDRRVDKATKETTEYFEAKNKTRREKRGKNKGGRIWFLEKRKNRK